VTMKTDCRVRIGLWATAAYLCLVAGCSTWRSREPAPPPLPPLGVPLPAERASGSLWRPDRGGNYPFVDVRPRFPGDLLTIVISEDAQGSKGGDTDLQSQSSIKASVREFFGLPAPANISPENIVEAESERSYSGDGETTRQASLTARITVTVTAVEPNGNLHVEGQKVTTLNNEKEYIVLRGVVRPEDIDMNNEVESWRVADARIDFYGSGVVANQLRPGYGYTLLDWLWPF
jgi:flagellar L-ring protein precursor FlgH